MAATPELPPYTIGFPSEEIKKKILEALNARVLGGGMNHPATCPLCGTREWYLVDGFIEIPLHTFKKYTGFLGMGMGPVAERSSLLSVAVVCSKCGDTRLINLRALGLGDITIKP